MPIDLPLLLSYSSFKFDFLRKILKFDRLFIDLKTDRHKVLWFQRGQTCDVM